MSVLVVNTLMIAAYFHVKGVRKWYRAWEECRALKRRLRHRQQQLRKLKEVE